MIDCMCDDVSTSGPVPSQSFHVTDGFTNFTEFPSRGHCRLVKAQRYGVWNVLKGLKPEYASEELYKEMVSKEFSLMVELNHPNIVRAYGLEQVPEFGTCIVMEFVDGRTLSDFIAEKPFETQRKQVMRELLDALSYFHKKQIVHQDLKPSNILITHDGNHVKVIDFGLSDSRGYAILKEPAYTKAYASPEQLAGGNVDNRADIYAFGLILQQLFPHKYAFIAKKCLQPQREKRYGTSEAVLEAIKQEDKKRKWLPAAICVALFFIVLSIFLLYHFNNQKEGLPDKISNEHLMEQSGVEEEAQPLNGNINTIKNAEIATQNDDVSENEAQEMLNQYIYNLKFELDSIIKPFDNDLYEDRIFYWEIFHNRLQITLLKMHIHIQQCRQHLPPEKQVAFIQYAQMMWGRYASKYPYHDSNGNSLYPYFESLYNAGKLSEDEYERLKKEDAEEVAELSKLSAQLKIETAKN